MRLNTYGNDPDIKEYQDLHFAKIYALARSGDMYVYGGWQTFVDGLNSSQNAYARIIQAGEKGKVRQKY